MLSSGWSWAGWVPTPYIRRRSPLRSIARSTRGRIPCADISYPEFRALTFYIRISHSRMGEEDVSTSPIRLIRDPLIALTRRVFLLVYSVAVFSWSFLIFPTDILGYFALDICCLNPQSLLVTHLSWDSLVFKQVKRVNNLIYIVCNFLYKDIKYVIGRKKKYILQSICSVFPGYICFLVSFLTSQTSSEEVSSENEWLDF